ncbi:phosphoserine transaminase [Oerskovia jenensis]|uniref:phosphoserine transaminase n=1 Tax=Oerskovia jenensis TaxID=162169 RepID=A0ABS2LI76_9CELL|nr:phosphoserine transaminase [Oerskovia jenensis]MBM7480067.1 phosphoserine aminotransferase [Oerskovia jenensis]
MPEPTQITVPPHLLPSDGRFGCGPSKVREAQVRALSEAGTSLLGTSHRQAPVKSLVGRIRSGLAELFDAPDGYEVVLGNGGSSAFWDVATLCLVRERAQHAAFGEFGAKFATATTRAPFLEASQVITAPPGSVAVPEAADGIDVYAWPHNETSTGAVAPVRRVAGSREQGALTLVDATSGAGALPVDLAETDVYYFAPQKVFGSDGGLWVAIMSPDAVARAQEIESGDRWVPEFLSLGAAITNSRQDQTLNTPAVATLVTFAEQVDWLNEQGGLEWASARSASSARTLYSWAESRDWATPFVARPEDRSTVVGTIDLDESIDATQVIAALRANGILDVFPYRKLGRNQLRIGMFPAIEPTDVELLTRSIDFVVDALA